MAVPLSADVHSRSGIHHPSIRAPAFAANLKPAQLKKLDGF